MCSSDLPKVAVRKIHVFRGLMDSISGLPLCVFLICHKEAVVAISDHLEKVCRSNLFEFFCFWNYWKILFNKAFDFSSTKLCQIINVACSNKLIHSTTFVFKIARLEKHLKRFLVKH